jgi:hypothetical protein
MDQHLAILADTVRALGEQIALLETTKAELLDSLHQLETAIVESQAEFNRARSILAAAFASGGGAQGKRASLHADAGLGGLR